MYVSSSSGNVSSRKEEANARDSYVSSFPRAPSTSDSVRLKCREMLAAALRTGGECRGAAVPPTCVPPPLPPGPGRPRASLRWTAPPSGPGWQVGPALADRDGRSRGGTFPRTGSPLLPAPSWASTHLPPLLTCAQDHSQCRFFLQKQFGARSVFFSQDFPSSIFFSLAYFL